jgi:imidazole glycerol-phosphate synthase subunit HisH
MIGIVDYGMGNLHSVSKALERLDYEYILSDNPEELKKAKGLILPGVGSFKDAVEALERTGLKTFVEDYVAEGKPLLGICLGMQLLFEESDENGLAKGFGFLPGRVERFSGATQDGEAYKVPHMGWNYLHFHDPSSVLLKELKEDYVYFVHSYVVKTKNVDVTLASAQYYDVKVPAVVGRENVFGTQFHPEKSSKTGLAILQNYADFIEGK